MKIGVMGIKAGNRKLKFGFNEPNACRYEKEIYKFVPAPEINLSSVFSCSDEWGVRCSED
jgi:hypothetical protein